MLIKDKCYEKLCGICICREKQIDFNEVIVTLVLPSKKKVAELSVLKLEINTETYEAKGF